MTPLTYFPATKWHWRKGKTSLDLSVHEGKVYFSWNFIMCNVHEEKNVFKVFIHNLPAFVRTTRKKGSSSGWRHDGEGILADSCFQLETLPPEIAGSWFWDDFLGIIDGSINFSSRTSRVNKIHVFTTFGCTNNNCRSKSNPLVLTSQHQLLGALVWSVKRFSANVPQCIRCYFRFPSDNLPSSFVKIENLQQSEQMFALSRLTFSVQYFLCRYVTKHNRRRWV